MRTKSMEYHLFLNTRKFTKLKRYFVSGIKRMLVIIVVPVLLSNYVVAQSASTGGVQAFSLQDCIDYAIKNQPDIKQAEINLSITKSTNFISASGWLPQVNGAVNFVHYPQVPTSLIENPSNPNGPLLAEKSAVVNSLVPALSATQAIFSPSLLYAATSAKLYVKQAKLEIDSSKIGIAVAVSKSFYNLLLTLQEIEVLKADTVSLAQNLKDAYHQYVGGIVDETDYEQAQISLNNSVSQLKQADESIRPQYAALKQYMGYPSNNQFNVVYDTSQMLKDASLDTTQQLQYEKRIELQELETAKALQHKLTLYYELAFLPTLGAYYNYNLVYESNKMSDLTTTAYPNSYVGLSLNLPLFTGLSRIESVHRAKLQEKLFDWSEQNLKAVIFSQYAQAIANYNSNVFNMHTQQDNAALALRVYNVVNLQYKQGIVPYLNVITAQSNLITSQLNYLNALFQVLSSKVDVEQAMGQISY